jgi:hypothetical protein
MTSLLAGLVCLLAAIGIGSALLRRLSIGAPATWGFPLSLLSGVAAINTCVMLALFFGGGVRTLRILSAFLLLAAGYEVLRYRNLFGMEALPRLVGRERWMAAVVLAALALNLCLALAPSTKIDELYYHMLVPKRVISDDGLRAYREPFAAAIYPQMAFQYGLSAAHAWGIPEAGNVVSWGLSAALIVLVIGTVTELTGELQAGWLFGGVAVVGLYTAVWHVTSGAHALGDLATAMAGCLCLLPAKSLAWVREGRRLGLVSLAACTAASTKISLLPVCAAITLLTILQARRSIGWRKAAGIPLGVWAVLYMPPLLWSGIQTGSPFGVATASLFHSAFFGADTLGKLAESREAGRTGLLQALRLLAISVSVGQILALGAAAAGARQWASLRILLGLVAGQVLLIVFFLPQEFRFLGGLQFVVLILGAGELSSWAMGKRWLLRSRLLAIPLCLPWLAAQAYYARPFIAVDLGVESRDSFIDRNVAFASDFRALDRLLPNDAVLYATRWHLPAYYAPRPVIFTMEDLPPGHHPVYRFRVGKPITEAPLLCPDLVYENQQAFAAVYRTPGRPAIRETLRVERCTVECCYVPKPGPGKN